MWITPLDFRKVWISGARRKDGGKMYALPNLFFAAAAIKKAVYPLKFV